MRHIIPILFFAILSLEGFAQDFRKSAASSELIISLDTVAAEIGDTVQISMRGFGFIDIYALYGTILYDTTSLELISYNPDSLVNNLSVNLDTAGQLPFSWFFTSPYGATFPDSSSLFSMDFKIIGTSESSTLTFADSPSQLEYWSDYTPFGGWNIYFPDTVPGQISLIETPVGLKENPRTDLLVYPNPTNWTLTIGGLDGQDMYRIDIITSDGKIIYRDQELKGHIMNISELPVGQYLVSVRGPRIVFVERFFKTD